MRIDSHGLHWQARAPTAAEFGRNLPPKLPNLPSPPSFPGGVHGDPPMPHNSPPFPQHNPLPSHDNLPFSRVDHGFLDHGFVDRGFGDHGFGDRGFGDHGFVGRGFGDHGFGGRGFTVDAVTATPDGPAVVLIEAVSGEHAIAVSHDSDGAVTVTNHKGQRYTVNVPPDAQVVVRGGEIYGRTAAGNMSGTPFFHEPSRMETSPRALTLVGGAGEDRLVADIREARPYGSRVHDDLPAKLRNEIPLWVVQGPSVWQLRLRPASWGRRRRLLRWLERLRRVSKARRKTEPLPVELVDPLL